MGISITRSRGLNDFVLQAIAVLYPCDGAVSIEDEGRGKGRGGHTDYAGISLNTGREIVASAGM